MVNIGLRQNEQWLLYAKVRKSSLDGLLVRKGPNSFMSSVSIALCVCTHARMCTCVCVHYSLGIVFRRQMSNWNVAIIHSAPVYRKQQGCLDIVLPDTCTRAYKADLPCCL